MHDACSVTGRWCLWTQKKSPSNSKAIKDRVANVTVLKLQRMRTVLNLSGDWATFRGSDANVAVWCAHVCSRRFVRRALRLRTEL